MKKVELIGFKTPKENNKGVLMTNAFIAFKDKDYCEFGRRVLTVYTKFENLVIAYGVSEDCSGITFPVCNVLPVVVKHVFDKIDDRAVYKYSYIEVDSDSAYDD